MKNIVAIGTVLSGIFVNAPAMAVDHGTRTFHVEGEAVTGINETCGEPLWLLPLPDPHPPTLHGAFIGEFDPTPGAVDALPLTPSNCDDDILLATTTDQIFIAAFDVPDMDPRLKNIPLRDVPVMVDLRGVRTTLPPPGALPANPFPPTKSIPHDPITLGDWLSAGGDMRVKCKADGSASVKIKYWNLIPNGVYSVWAIWRTTPPDGFEPTVVPLPLGGIPHVFAPDEHGKATFERQLAACPMDPTPDGSLLLFVGTAFHSDGNVYGAVPEPLLDTIDVRLPDGTVFTSNLAPGAVAHDHVDFLVNGSEIQD